MQRTEQVQEGKPNGRGLISRTGGKEDAGLENRVDRVLHTVMGVPEK